jgi:SPP1 family predicted phage head-tail adaptor
MPAAGRLDELYDVERATVVQDETGEPIETWTVWKSVWLGRQDVMAAERFRANQDMAIETTVLVGHYLPGLRHDDRLRRRQDGAIFDIVGLAELGRRAGWQITAQATRV